MTKADQQILYWLERWRSGGVLTADILANLKKNFARMSPEN